MAFSGDGQNKDTNPKNLLPKGLKLAFSQAADDKRINVFFDPDVKAKVDPSKYITKRKEGVFKDSIASGCVAFLEDDNKDVVMLAVAYQVCMNDNHAPQSQHDYTEMATAMSRLRDYHNADLVIAALTMKEWWLSPPNKMIMASVDCDNKAAQRIAPALDWERVADPATVESLFYPVYKTAVDETGQNRDIPLPPQAEKDRVWFYACADKAIIKQAKILLQLMDAGGVTNKKTNHTIPVDFSALAQIGLTRARLEAVARGDLSRKHLNSVPQKPPVP